MKKKKKKKKEKKKKTERGQCDSLMVLQTMAGKCYKRLLKTSIKSFRIYNITYRISHIF